MRDRLRLIIERMDAQQKLINSVTSNVSSNVNQTKKPKLGTTPVLQNNMHTNEPIASRQEKERSFVGQASGTIRNGDLRNLPSMINEPKYFAQNLPFKQGDEKNYTVQNLPYKADPNVKINPKDYVQKLKETESVTPANQIGGSAPANPASPIAMPEKLLKPKKTLRRVLTRK